VALGDKDLTTHYNYGVVLINLGRSADAKPVFENLLSLDENYADAYYHLGIIYIGLGEVIKSKELLQRFIDLDPENSNAPLAKKIIESLN
jgi:tetratricopeptide (TPR) repeat protein